MRGKLGVRRDLADGYQECDGYYVFGVVADAEDESDIEGLAVTGLTRSNPLRVIVTPVIRTQSEECERDGVYRWDTTWDDETGNAEIP
jgi:hypothetical protein